MCFSLIVGRCDGNISKMSRKLSVGLAIMVMSLSIKEFLKEVLPV